MRCEDNSCKYGLARPCVPKFPTLVFGFGEARVVKQETVGLEAQLTPKIKPSTLKGRVMFVRIVA